jgi:hypothetical protein
VSRLSPSKSLLSLQALLKGALVKALLSVKLLIQDFFECILARIGAVTAVYQIIALMKQQMGGDLLPNILYKVIIPTQGLFTLINNYIGGTCRNVQEEVKYVIKKPVCYLGDPLFLAAGNAMYDTITIDDKNGMENHPCTALF